MGAKFEYTMPCTPQQNGGVERKFVILFNWEISMLNDVEVFSVLEKCQWAEAANTAILLENT